MCSINITLIQSSLQVWEVKYFRKSVLYTSRMASNFWLLSFEVGR